MIKYSLKRPHRQSGSNITDDEELASDIAICDFIIVTQLSCKGVTVISISSKVSLL